MLGNVWEWTADCWRPRYANAPADGSARVEDECERRAIRGGSWKGGPKVVRSGYHVNAGAGMRVSHVGFRVARAE